MLDYIKYAVEKFGDTYYGTQWCLIIHKENVDKVDEWLNKYTQTEEGDWLKYNIQQCQNIDWLYVLILSSSY